MEFALEKWNAERETKERMRMRRQAQDSRKRNLGRKKRTAATQEKR